MLGKVIIENGQKKIQALTADTGAGAPVGSYLYLEKKSNPQGYLYCDGSTFDETVYPALYQYLGTNVLPDWREFSAVGAEENTTNVYDAQTNPDGVIHDHDVFAQGEAKDDQLQEHVHNVTWHNASGVFFAPQSSGYPMQDNNSPADNGITGARKGNVTRGKSKAVFIYIKATSGLTENQQENVLNTINENNSYSTEEHPTGAKWIDGKPIYRKVFVHEETGLGNPSFDYGTISSFGQLIEAKTITVSNSGGNQEVEFMAYRRSRASISNGVATFINEPQTTYNVDKYILIVEYTKTTD